MEFVPKSELELAQRKVRDCHEYIVIIRMMLQQKIERIPKDTKKGLSSALTDMVNDMDKIISDLSDYTTSL